MYVIIEIYTLKLKIKYYFHEFRMCIVLCGDNKMFHEITDEIIDENKHYIVCRVSIHIEKKPAKKTCLFWFC